MEIVDSAESTARVVRKMLQEHPTLSPTTGDKGGAPESAENLNCHFERSEVATATERGRRTPIAAAMSASQHRTFRFYVTDSVEKFKRLATRFLGRQVDNVEHVDLGG